MGGGQCRADFGTTLRNHGPAFLLVHVGMYSRLPGSKAEQDSAAEVYPLLTNAYWDWTNKVDIDGDLLTATPNNWDDNPRYDLIFKEIKYEPGWNSWWNDLTRCCRENKLDDPAPSSQLGYGAVVLNRLALALGWETEGEADRWAPGPTPPAGD